ncbi:fimbria/pilus outer membrane usher protein [Salmonella enterica]|uniref:fimbria/pilus outer membrane usher protein n=1 Tax=Salmonella enterica TaxID=28901 RepID=UPI0013B0618D
MSGSWNRYWSEQSNTQYSLGYSNAFRWGTYSITAQRSYDENNDSDDSVYLSFNLPFEKLSPNFKKNMGLLMLIWGCEAILTALPSLTPVPMVIQPITDSIIV